MIYIITACSRPENLEVMSKTIPRECSWVIVYDDRISMPAVDNAMLMKCEHTGIVGVKAQNFALDNLPLTDDDFVMLLDDDNIIHPEWYPTVSKLLDQNFAIMTWGQLNNNNSIRLDPQEKPAVGNIDTGSFMVSWKYVKYIRHDIDVYEHDGIYANKCSNSGPVLCVNRHLCYYNYLR